MTRNNMLFCLVMCLIALTLNSYSQAPTPPKEEYKLYSDVTTISLEQGQTDSVQISILRSKGFKNGKASLTLTSPVIQGLTVRMESVPSEADNYVMYVSADNDVEPGEYSILPTWTLNNKMKGIVMKVIVK